MTADATTAPTAATAPTAPTIEGLEAKTSILTLSTVVVSGANYLFALVMIRLLSAADYVAYVSVQGVLLVLGTGCMAAVPWAVAHHVAVDRSRRAAGEALRFGLVASVVQGALFAVVAAGVVVPVSGWGLGLVTAAAAFALSVIAAPVGLLQGRGHLAGIAWLRLVEMAVRLGSSLVLVWWVASSPLSPVAGFALGSLVLFGLSTWMCRDAFPLVRASAADLRRLLRRSVTLGGAQAALACIGVVDTVVIGLAHLGDGAASSYQVAALLGRVPLFLSTAVALGFYPRMVAAGSDDEARGDTVSALRLFARLGLPAALIVATLPPPLLAIVAPDASPHLSAVLPATALIGLLIGTLTVLTTWQQARERFGRLFRVLAPIALAQPFLLVAVGRQWSVAGYAWCGVALAAAAALAIVRDVGVRGWGRLLSRGGLLLLLAGGALVMASRDVAFLWAMGTALLVVSVVRAPFRRASR